MSSEPIAVVHKSEFKFRFQKEKMGAMKQSTDEPLERPARWVCWQSVGLFCLFGSVLSFLGRKLLPLHLLPAGFSDWLVSWQNLLALVLFCGAFWASVRAWGLANQPRRLWWKDLISGGYFLVVMGLFVCFGLGVFSFRASKVYRYGPGSTRQMISNLETSLKLYQFDNGQFPTSTQGLNVLIAKPTMAPVPKNWRGPYMEKIQIPLDRWGSAYVYRCPGMIHTNGFDVVSPGPNRILGDADDIFNAD